MGCCCHLKVGATSLGASSMPRAPQELSPQAGVPPGAAPHLHPGPHLAAEEEQHRGALAPLPGHRPAGIPPGTPRECAGTPREQPGAVPERCPLCAQLSLSVHGPERSLEFQARAPGADFVSAVFAGKAVASLFDGRWHKVVVAVQGRAVSVHLDCASIASKPLGPRRALAPEGNAFLGLDAVRGTPVRVSAPGSGGALPTVPGPPLSCHPRPAAVRHPASPDLLRRRAGQAGGVLRDLCQRGEGP